MKRLAMDIETDSLDATRIHVICTQDIQTGERRQYLNTSHIPEEKERFLGDIRPYDCFVLHNGIGFDIPTMNRLLGEGSIDIKKTLDTLVLSRLFDIFLTFFEIFILREPQPFSSGTWIYFFISFCYFRMAG